MAAGPVPVADLAKQAGANEDALYRVMRAGEPRIFDEVSPRTFTLTLAGRMLQKAELPRHGPVDHEAFISGVCRNAPLGADRQPAADKVAGEPVFGTARPENRELSEINNAMTGFSEQIVPTALEVYDFNGIGTLVDVAGGHGILLTSI